IGRAADGHAAPTPATPPELVAAYDDLATAILAVKKSEESLVRSVLATTYGHAQASVQRALHSLQAGDSQAAQKALEDVAAYVAQLGAEGDNAVAGIRKRLVEGGHHHHASAESKGEFDPGYVVVSNAVKKQLLDASRDIVRMSKSATAEGIANEWSKVEAIWKTLQKR
ncbi:MAG: hypothetical protein KDA61_04740, partial [Planctomycetales bacterium]|nr:hypothetical protein [Planctomycetales bacterium]